MCLCDDTQVEKKRVSEQKQSEKEKSWPCVSEEAKPKSQQNVGQKLNEI